MTATSATSEIQRTVDWPEAVPSLSPEHIALLQQDSDQNCIMTLSEWAAETFRFTPAWEVAYSTLFEQLDKARGFAPGKSWPWDLSEAGDGVTRDKRVTAQMLASVWKSAMVRLGYAT